MEYYTLAAKDRKARFSIAWMKVLTNFQPKRPTQERAIIERFFAQEGEKIFDNGVVHAVVSTIHELVYVIVHSNIRERKLTTASSEAGPSKAGPAVETEETLYRYGGFALQKMLKKRNETLQQKKGRMTASKQRRPLLESEIKILQACTMKDKSNLSPHLKRLDEGNLTFPRVELIPFIREVDLQVRDFCNDANFRKYPTKFIDMCQSSVSNNEALEVDFSLLMASLVNDQIAGDKDIVKNIYKEFVSKICNVRINEYKCAKEERELKAQGKVVDADEMLRPKLKAFAISTKRK